MIHRHSIEESIISRVTDETLVNIFQEMIKLNLLNKQSIFNHRKTPAEKILKKKILKHLCDAESKELCNHEEQHVKIGGVVRTKKID